MLTKAQIESMFSTFMKTFSDGTVEDFKECLLNKIDIVGEESISLERAKKYARHQHFIGSQGKDFIEFEDWKTKL